MDLLDKFEKLINKMIDIKYEDENTYLFVQKTSIDI